MTEWQAIHTVPKDGRGVLVWRVITGGGRWPPKHVVASARWYQPPNPSAKGIWVCGTGRTSDALGSFAVSAIRMTPDEFKAARKRLGLSAEEMAQFLRLKDARTVRNYESGARRSAGRSPCASNTVSKFGPLT